MRVRDTRWLALPLLGLLLASCASNPAPRGWLPSASESQEDPYGAWVVVKYADTAIDESLLVDSSPAIKGTSCEGELIALESNLLYVLVDSSLIAVPREQITEVRICAYEANYGGLAMWNFLGSLSTVSNGYLGGITLPLWLIVGSLSVAGQSHAPFERYDPRYFHREDSWAQLRQYARFPQGLSPTLDSATLRPKPFSRLATRSRARAGSSR